MGFSKADFCNRPLMADGCLSGADLRRSWATCAASFQPLGFHSISRSATGPATAFACRSAAAMTRSRAYHHIPSAQSCPTKKELIEVNAAKNSIALPDPDSGPLVTMATTTWSSKMAGKPGLRLPRGVRRALLSCGSKTCAPRLRSQGACLSL